MQLATEPDSDPETDYAIEKFEQEIIKLLCFSWIVQKYYFNSHEEF